MEKWIAPLCSWCWEVLKPYKICQILAKWNFAPPAKFCLELHALPSSPGCTDKLLLSKKSLAVFSMKPLAELVEDLFSREEVGWSNLASSFLPNKNLFIKINWLRGACSRQPTHHTPVTMPCAFILGMVGSVPQGLTHHPLFIKRLGFLIWVEWVRSAPQGLAHPTIWFHYFMECGEGLGVL